MQTDGAAEVVHAQVLVADVEDVEGAVEHVGEEVVVVRGVERFVLEAVAREVDGDGAVGFGEAGRRLGSRGGGATRSRLSIKNAGGEQLCMSALRMLCADSRANAILSVAIEPPKGNYGRFRIWHATCFSPCIRATGAARLKGE